MDKSHPEYNQLNKRISKETRKDYHTYNSKMIKEVIEDNLNIRVLKVKTAIGKSKFFKIKNEEGLIMSDRNDIATIVENFYRKLCSITVSAPNSSTKTIINVGSEELPEITTFKISAETNEK